MNLGILLFLVAGAVFISMVAVTFSLILPLIKARANLKQRISVASGNVSVAVVTRGIGAESRRRRDIQSRLQQLEVELMAFAILRHRPPLGAHEDARRLSQCLDVNRAVRMLILQHAGPGRRASSG